MISKRLLPIVTAAGILFSAGIWSGCEREVPLSSLDISYETQYRIEGDFFPAHLAKSVLRVDRTFGIGDTLSIARAHIRDARAELWQVNGGLLSTFTWRDSAQSYPYLVNPGDIQQGPIDPEDAEIDTQYYGAYKLDDLDFQLADSLTYQLRVHIDGEEFRTHFSPYPAVEFIGLEPDTIIYRREGETQIPQATYYLKMSRDSARLEWPEDPSGYFYTVFLRQLRLDRETLPQVFAFPGPLLDFTLPVGRYMVIIGAMNRTFYRHYYLNEFPLNHETRNFFDGEALGYAGTLNERYLVVRITN